MRRSLILPAIGVLLLMGRGEVVNAAAQVRVAKHGDRVVFTIANGDRAHSVYESTDPNRFDSSGRLSTTAGSFVIRADEGADLVFYKID